VFSTAIACTGNGASRRRSCWLQTRYWSRMHGWVLCYDTTVISHSEQQAMCISITEQGHARLGVSTSCTFQSERDCVMRVAIQLTGTGSQVFSTPTNQ